MRLLHVNQRAPSSVVSAALARPGPAGPAQRRIRWLPWHRRESQLPLTSTGATVTPYYVSRLLLAILTMSTATSNSVPLRGISYGKRGNSVAASYCGWEGAFPHCP